jgi:hypothetical protein
VPNCREAGPADYASAFERGSHVRPLGDGRFASEVPDGWQQGRGAFGGLVLGTLARAVELTVADPARRIRTVAGDLCGPVLPGPAEITVRILRRGANQTNVAAELRQEGEVLATATMVLSTPRTVDVPTRSPEPPSAPPAQGLDPLPIGPPLGPVFASHYEYRAWDSSPFSGGGDASVAGWIREREPPERLDAAAMIARLDAWWPALFAVSGAPRPMATIQFTAELLVDPATIDPAAPLHHRASVLAMREGFCVEARELWSADQLVAMNQQTFAVLR